MPQTASGRPNTAQQGSVLHEGYRVFVADATVQPQRLAAYEYAELIPKGTRSAMPCPAGGELHQPDGSIIPVSPWDWVVENPDGTLSSITAEEVADHWEFDSGPDDFAEAHALTRKHVKAAREKPRANPPMRVENAPRELHPDGFEAATVREQERTHEQLRHAMEQQAQEARQQLQKVVSVAQKRELITDEEATDWLEEGVQPEGIEVSFDAVLGTYGVRRVTPDEKDVDPGDQDVDSDGSAPAEK